MPKKTRYPIKDFTSTYKPIMQFNINKTSFIHQWYPFVEGYSKEFISNILAEIDYTPESVLDPFSGSGTTAVELQDRGINCTSYEVSPFMHLLSTVKLDRNYNSNEFTKNVKTIAEFLENTPYDIRKCINPPAAKTFQRNKKLDKWIFNIAVMDGILDIKYAILLLENDAYKKLFLIALASILLEVSNVYRNGKCLSYKSDWKDKKTQRRSVHKLFLKKLEEIIEPDIKELEKKSTNARNKENCFLGDVRTNIKNLSDNSIDLVITSPPYLNSRDYTDIYIVELWVLDLIKDYKELKTLRSQTLRSHVQVKYDEIETLNIDDLKKVLEKINKKKNEFWNKELPRMIKGYFEDMNILFEHLRNKMQNEKKVFFNVANSAYYGIEIKVDEIVSQIAENQGFKIEEIREARQLKPSCQQKNQITSLRESVIVMTS